MALVNTILQHKPADWDHYSYTNRRYMRVGLQPHSSEYRRINNEFSQAFPNASVTSIERVQHPFAYGRFQMRKEQLTAVNRQAPIEKRKFVTITDPAKIDIIIDYNCDYRRGGFNHSSVVSGDGYVLAVKMFGNFDERDTHRYPEYLIKYRAASYNPYSSDVHEMLGRLRLYDDE